MKIMTTIVAVSAASALLLTGCSAPAAENKDSKSIEVEQGFFEKSITLPASLVEGQDFATYQADMLAQGVTSVTQNEDGSVTIKMPDAVHQVMLDKMLVSMDESIDQAIVDQAGVVTDISYNKSVSEFSVTVDKAGFESSIGAGFIGLSLGLQGMFYQLFNGVAEPKTTINFVDGATGEVFDTVVYPDAMQTTE